jgi:hypothetical protein
MPIKQDPDRLAWGDLEAAARTGCRAVDLDALADVALDDLQSWDEPVLPQPAHAIYRDAVQTPRAWSV